MENRNTDFRRRVVAVAANGEARPRSKDRVAPPNLDFALHYAKRWFIFPVPPGTRKSYLSADKSGGRSWGMSRDPAEITGWFDQWPDAGIGIPQGAVNGIVVIETDTKAGGHAHDGEPVWLALEAKHGPPLTTLTAISPSGSIHRYFRHPGADIKIKCSASEIGPGIDVKGDGGMVIAPPTLRPGVGRYYWENRGPIAPMPRWLINLTREKPPQSYISLATDSPAVKGDNYARAALKGEIDDLCHAADGDRNHALNRAAFSLHQLIDRGLLNAAEVDRELIRACETNGLMADRENGGINAIRKTIASAAAGAKKHPRGPR